MSTAPVPTKRSLSDADRQVILRMMLGGGASGLALAGGVSLANYLKTLRDEAKADTSADDDTLTINVPRAKQASDDGMDKEAMVTSGLGITGATLTALGSYALIRNAYQKLKKKRTQEMLDEAQKRFITTSLEAGEAGGNAKAAAAGEMPAGRAPGALDVVSGMPVATSLLLMLGSAAMANAYLKKAFPGAGANKRVKPRRVVLKYDETDESREKVASIEGEHGMECLAKIAVHMLGDRQDSDLPDLAYALGQGRLEEFCAALEFGSDAALDTVKGASALGASDAELSAGVMLGCRDPRVAPMFTTLALSEWNDLAPNLMKIAGSLGQDEMDALEAAMCLTGAITKVASAQEAEAFAESDAPVLDDLVGLARREKVIQLPKKHIDAAASLGRVSAEEDIVNKVMGA